MIYILFFFHARAIYTLAHYKSKYTTEDKGDVKGQIHFSKQKFKTEQKWQTISCN